MNIQDLKLYDFRNYRELNIDFDPGVNLIVGNNAQGKTNLLEAIAYLGCGKSFRAQKTVQMLRFGTDFCQIEGNVFSQERQQNLRWVLFSDGRKRQLWKNGAKQKTAEDISGIMSTILFCPEDLFVLKAGASARRKFCDTALCQLRPNYDAALSEYNRILEQKGRILKDHFENPALLEILPEFNQRLCQVGALIISYRARFFQALGEAAKQYHQQFSGGAEEFSLQYRTVSTVKDPFAPVAELVENLQEHLQSHYRGELESANCLTGPHKDDFSVSLSGMDLKDYGSQGQTRTSAISLKLAQRDLMKREWGEEPILLLDDVLSELDPARQDFVLNHITAGQVFITCCEPEKLTRLGTTISIENGRKQNK
jgi:DNA replication and repair protein RecF